MNDLELIFTMLGEASTTHIAKNKNAQGFEENKDAAVEGGNVAGTAIKELEKRSGKKVAAPENFLEKPQKMKKREEKSENKRE
jgi:hypothetical protein